MKNYDSWKFREDGERMVECNRHTTLHLENDPCPECYDLSKDQERRRAQIRLKNAVKRANETHGLHDAINQYYYEHLKEGGRIY